MHKRFAWGAVAGLILVGCSTGGSGGSGGNPAGVFSADGGYLNPPSYRACISNMECSGFESCGGIYSGAFNAYVGVCTRGCFKDSECSGDVCLVGHYPQVCTKRCSASSECGGASMVCGDGGYCTGYSMQSQQCRSYIACYERTGGAVGSLDSSYGPSGTCWTTSAAAAQACTNACGQALPALKSAYPDAGC